MKQPKTPKPTKQPTALYPYQKVYLQNPMAFKNPKRKGAGIYNGTFDQATNDADSYDQNSAVARYRMPQNKNRKKM